MVLRLLGPVRLEVDGVDRTPLGPVLRGLLATLGCARGEAVPWQTLTAVLAQLGESDPAPAGRCTSPGSPRSSAPPRACSRAASGVRLAGPGLVTDLDSVDEAVDAAAPPRPPATEPARPPRCAGHSAAGPARSPTTCPGCRRSRGSEPGTRRCGRTSSRTSRTPSCATGRCSPPRSRSGSSRRTSPSTRSAPGAGACSWRRSTSPAGPSRRCRRSAVRRTTPRAGPATTATTCCARSSGRRCGGPGCRSPGPRTAAGVPPWSGWTSPAGRSPGPCRRPAASSSAGTPGRRPARRPLGVADACRGAALGERLDVARPRLPRRHDAGRPAGHRRDAAAAGDVVRCGDVVLLVADGRADGRPRGRPRGGGAADLRDASALAEPIVVQLGEERRPVL